MVCSLGMWWQETASRHPGHGRSHFISRDQMGPGRYKSHIIAWKNLGKTIYRTSDGWWWISILDDITIEGGSPYSMIMSYQYLSIQQTRVLNRRCYEWYTLWCQYFWRQLQTSSVIPNNADESIPPCLKYDVEVSYNEGAPKWMVYNGTSMNMLRGPSSI